MSIDLTINGHIITAQKGATILQAARSCGIAIPTLCDYPGLPASGSCRLCIVEIEGRSATPTACTTPVEAGMVVFTHSEKVKALRKELLQMLLAEHPACCFTCPETDHCQECMITLRKVSITTGCRSCPKDGQCTLQSLVDEIGLPESSFPMRYRALPVEKNDPFFDRDYNLCVLCGRCIRTCQTLHFTNILAYTQRGTDTVVGVAFQRTHVEAGCSFCGACVQVCPTGALSEKTRKWDGAPQAEILTTCPLCSLGCQVDLLTGNGRVIGSLPAYTAGHDNLCVAGRFAFAELLNHPDRLLQPQRRAGDFQLKIDWEEAQERICERLIACPPGAGQVVLSADLSIEDQYVAHKFSQEILHSQPLTVLQPDGAALTTRAARALWEIGQPLTALQQAGSIFAFGVDARYEQSVVEVAIHRACRQGARLVTVHTSDHSLAPFADEWLRPTPQDEIAVLQALIARLLGRDMPSSHDPGVHRQITHAAQLLESSGNAVILLGPQLLAQPNFAALIPDLVALNKTLAAHIVLLPQDANLASALLMAALFHEASPLFSSPRLRYLIGVDPALVQSQAGEIILHHLFASNQAQDLPVQLPLAAFSESEASTIDHAGQIRTVHAAVSQRHHARPAWQALCQIARRMGAAGFDFTSVEEIRAEIAIQLPGFQANGRLPWSTLSAAYQPQVQCMPATNGPSTLGLPLSHYVAGFKALYPINPTEKVLDV